MVVSMEKSDHAFRTISEAADSIGVPQHVLRFWETRFPQLQPLKRGGNRRYYRPADMALLETIRSMLHDQGLTIRGAKLLMEGAAEPPRKSRKSAAGGEAATGESAPVLAATVPPGIDRVLLRTIRDRLRYALSA